MGEGRKEGKKKVTMGSLLDCSIHLDQVRSILLIWLITLSNSRGKKRSSNQEESDGVKGMKGGQMMPFSPGQNS